MNGRNAGERIVSGARFELHVDLPARHSTVRVVAFDAFGNRAERTVAPVFGIAKEAAPAPARPYEDEALARKLRALVDDFPGTAGIYVENLATGAGAAWNARARFPAASTLKLGIAIEVLRVLEQRPQRGSSFDRLLRLMLVHSDNAAANELLAWLGGSLTSGAERVNATMEALGLPDSHMYGGYLTAVSSRAPIPLTVESQPTFEGKYTSAWDLAQLHRFVHLAAGARGPLVDELDGTFTPADARFLLYVLAHSADRGKLDRYVGEDVVVTHKAGWVAEARHDSGLLLSPDGPVVVSVMTWTGGGPDEPSDELAGRVAKVALEQFRTRSGADDAVSSFSFSF